MLPPDSRTKVAWDILLAVTVLASSLVFPYRLLSGQDPFDGIYWLVTLVLALDVVLGFFTAFRKGTEVVDDPAAVRRHYLRTWFAADLLAALPLPVLFASVPGPSGSAVRGLLLALRLVKLLKMKEVFRSLQEALDVNPAAMRLVVFAFWFSLVVHFVSVGWLAIGGGDAEGAFGMRYLRALYWCITTIATVGYGDITPDRSAPWQLVYTMAVELFGVSVYGFIIGNIASLIANLDVRQAAFKRKMEEVREYMRSRRLPPVLQQRVRNYYLYLWETRRSVSDEGAILAELPHTLATDISLYLNRAVLEKVPLFRGAPELFLREVVRELVPVVFLPEDYIIRQGEHADCMYFVSSGEVEVLVDGRSVARLGAGSFFGEAALLEGGLRTASVRALTYCETYRLSRSDFDLLRAKYEDFDRRVREIVAERMAQIRK